MGTPPPLPSLALSPDKVEERIQEITASHAHTAHLTPGRDTRTQLYVGNLPYRVRWQDLKDLFRNAGCNVLRADVSLGPDNRSRGYGTVLLATAEDAGRAIDRFNGFTWQTRVLDVRVDRLPPNGESTGEPTLFQPDEHDYPTSGKNLFVGNLPFHIQWQDLKDLFRQAGTIIRADVALGVDGRSRGFGTVVFASEADAEHAVKIFDGYEFNGRKLKVHHDKYSTQNSHSTISSPSLSASLLSASPSLLHSGYALGEMNSSPLVNSLATTPFRVRPVDEPGFWHPAQAHEREELTATSLAASMKMGLHFTDARSTHSPLLNAKPPSLSRAASLNRAGNFPLGKSPVPAGIASLHASSPSPLSLGGDLPPSPRLSSGLASSRFDSPRMLNPAYDALSAPGSSRINSRKNSYTRETIPSWKWSQGQGPSESAIVDLSSELSRPSSTLSSATSSPRSSSGLSTQRPQPTSTHTDPAPKPNRPNLNLAKTTPQSGRSAHPHHPGPISLPPAPYPTTESQPISPTAAGSQGVPMYPVPGPFTPPVNGIANNGTTPYGGMPFTPSMPPFTFLPPWTPVVQTPGGNGQAQTPLAGPGYAPHGYFGALGPATPPLSPGFPVTFAQMPMPSMQQVAPGHSESMTSAEAESGEKGSEKTPSPPSSAVSHPPPQPTLFTPGVAMSPYQSFPSHINPAVGAPVHLPIGSPGGYFFSPMYYPMPSPGQSSTTPGGGGPSGGYFDFSPQPAVPQGYFPPASSTETGGGEETTATSQDKRVGVEKAIMRTPEEERALRAMAAKGGSGEEVNSPLSEKSDFEEDEDGSHSAATSSRGTSWHNSDIDEGEGLRPSKTVDARAGSISSLSGKKAGWMEKDESMQTSRSSPLPQPQRSESMK